MRGALIQNMNAPIGYGVMYYKIGMILQCKFAMKWLLYHVLFMGILWQILSMVFNLFFSY
jgi:hypothetical protein